MNDFTKEELNKLKLAIMYEYDRDGLLDTKHIAYRLQYLIDNYCEHKEREYIGDVPVGECNNCHMVIL